MTPPRGSRFAGSDELAAQIRKGVKPDVFAAANTKLPDQLFDEGLVEKPVDLRGQPAGARGAGGPRRSRRSTTSPSRASSSRWAPSRCRSAPTPARCWAGSRRPGEGDPGQRPLERARRLGHRRQADAGRRRRRLRLRHRRHGRRGRAQGRSSCPRRCNRASTTASAVVKGAEQPEAGEGFIDGLPTGPGEEALDAAGFEPPPMSRAAAFTAALVAALRSCWRS